MLASASALPPVTLVRVVQTHERPVVGHLYTGLRIADLGAGITSIRCDAGIADKRLRARQTWSPGAKEFTCSWRIPAGSAGKKLLPWRYGFGSHYRIYLDGGGYTGGQFAWVVRRVATTR